MRSCTQANCHCRDWPTIPQVYLKGEFLGGCDIILGMHQSGELTTVRRPLVHANGGNELTFLALQLLQDNGIIPKEQAQPTDAGAS